MEVVERAEGEHEVGEGLRALGRGVGRPEGQEGEDGEEGGPADGGQDQDEEGDLGRAQLLVVVEEGVDGGGAAGDGAREAAGGLECEDEVTNIICRIS